MSCIFSRHPTLDERIAELREEIRVYGLCIGIEERKRVHSERLLWFYKTLFEHMRYSGANYEKYVIVKQAYIKSGKRYETISNRLTNLYEQVDDLKSKLDAAESLLYDER